MTRKVETVVVPKWGGNRDAGKIFQITEMDAERAEKWGYRLLLALNRGGGEIPQNVEGLGMVGVAILGINTFLRGNIRFEDLEPLLDEMFTCVRIVRDPRHPEAVTDIVPEADDIEEAQTRAWLRSEVLRVHVNFSPAAALSALISVIMEKPEDSSST